MELLEVPMPTVRPGYLLVRNHFSLVSAGTEGSKVKTARGSLLQKARKKPDQVKQVLDSLKTEGVGATYQKVMNKLDFPAPLGYSCAGEVVEVGADVTGFKVGDHVACGGTSALHGEVVAVPKNLCVPVPKNVAMDNAAFTTVGAIAMQGIRQADVRLGEVVAVIGLGLIGQLTVQMLNAAGVKVVGIDIDPAMVKLAGQSGAMLAMERGHAGLEQSVLKVSDGYGVDAVIITAGTSSLDPVELAGVLCRKKGRVIIVGAVPTGFSRPNYYKKELELRMSASYGPGRYDDVYEDKGLDYPIGYVRWTENRNMRAFVDLLAAGRLNIDLLRTHTFSFENALQAYELIVNKSEPFLGIVLAYDLNGKPQKTVTFPQHISKAEKKVRVGFIGAGSFAQKALLPNVAGKAQMVAVATSTGNNATNIAQKYGFNEAVTDAEAVLEHPEINTVFIATRHNTHAEYVRKALQAGKHVFVEKPLALHEEALDEIKRLHEKQPRHLMVGFNRRFAPLIQTLRAYFNDPSPKAMVYRVNVGHIPGDHWTQDPEVGGGRIIGEACHFVDLCIYLADSRPVSVHALALPSLAPTVDTVTINLAFENGSVASIAYLANGNKSLDKEYLEIHSNGVSAVLRDFKQLDIYAKNKKSFKNTQDKGHEREVAAFLQAIEQGGACPVPFDAIYYSSLIPFKILQSIREGRVVSLP